MFNIPGLVFTGAAPLTAPHCTVVSPPKYGKSFLATTLINWPSEGDMPLILAFDKTGPESCAQAGYRIPYLRWADQAGANYREKAFAMLNAVERLLQGGGKKPCAIVCDCGSTFADILYDEAHRLINTKDNRQRYGYVKDITTSFYRRLNDLNIPVVWLAWARFQEVTVEDGKRSVEPGGSKVTGSFKDCLEGACDQLVLLDKSVAMPGEQGACSDGFLRKFWTKDYNGVHCDGRFKLPNPMPANLAYLFHYIMQGGMKGS